MKRLINSNLLPHLILSLAIIITLSLSFQSSNPKATAQHDIITQVNESKVCTASTQQTESFTITSVTLNKPAANNEYYGHSTTTDSNIYFTSDEIMSVGEVFTGDTITATFDTQGELLQVSKETQSTCEQNEILAEDGSCVNSNFYGTSTTSL